MKHFRNKVEIKFKNNILSFVILAYRSFCFNKKGGCVINANETTLYKEPNDTEIDNYRSMYRFQQ